jgi:glyoxylate carboligase
MSCFGSVKRVLSWVAVWLNILRATAYAKATGRLGVRLSTSGPGAIHLLNGLYDAKMDHMPVLAITGMQATSVLGTGYQQEVHTEQLYADLAEYNLVVSNPAQLPGVVDIAIRTALARRGVAHRATRSPRSSLAADSNRPGTAEGSRRVGFAGIDPGNRQRVVPMIKVVR